ncbi:Protein rai1 [Pleodorina starrii]|uniref:Protein rai1 n=1 Tax=Pleodorina starrii TaxID=330485 RepID=A0A9W6BRY2_9CHLO|nr:Protein rai1 [Pleodorina starrii]GLC71474.1 Protein rai1 [Pleodorina starrii]
MSAWKIVVNWLLPPPLILTLLLILPMPGVLKKGLLKVTRQFLFYQLGGPLQLVHVALVITGVVFAGSCITTYKLVQSPVDATLTPNQKTAVLARRWREERNFWIAALTFFLWGLLYRFYQLMLEHVALKDRVRQLELGLVSSTVASAGGGRAAPAGKGAAAAPAAAGGKGGLEPSAPPAPAEVLSNEAKKSK